MSITQATSFKIPEWATTLKDQIGPESFSAGNAILEGLFYSHLNHALNAWKIKWLSETAVSNFFQIQTLFNLTDTAATAFYAKTLFNCARQKYSLPVSVATTIAPFALGFFFFQASEKPIVSRDLNFETKSEIKRQEKIKVTITVCENLRSVAQKIAGTVQATKLIQQLGLCYFEKYNHSLGLDLASTIYSLFKNSQMTWSDFTSKHSDKHYSEIVTTTYRLLKLPLSLEAKSKNCNTSKCDKLADTAICMDHVYCTTCIAKRVKEKPATFDIYRATIGTTNTYSAKNYNFETFKCPSYGTSLPQEIKIQIKETNNKTQNAKIEMNAFGRDLQFDTIYAVYNIVHAGLSYLQKYPEFASTVFKVQKWMLIPDCLWYAWTVKQVHSKINDRLDENKKTMFYYATSAITAASLTLSYFAALHCNDYLKPTLSLKDTLSRMSLAPGIVNGTEIKWMAPLTQVLMQALSYNRIAATFALAFFLPDRSQTMTNLISSGAQLFSVANLLQLRWVNLTQIIEAPLKKTMATGGQLLQKEPQKTWKSRLNSLFLNASTEPATLNPEDIRSLKVSSYFLLNRACTEDTIHLQSALKAVLNRISHILDKSTWNRYLLKTKDSTGFVTGTITKFVVKLQEGAAQLCGCSRPINFVDLFLEAVTNTGLSAPVQIR